jgi:hypothetical protein
MDRVSYINLLKDKQIELLNYNPFCIQDGEIIALDSTLIRLIDDHMICKIFNTTNINKLSYGKILSTNELFTFFSKLRENEIKFSCNRIMMNILANHTEKYINIVFDYLCKIDEFDSYDFIYDANITVHILETIKTFVEINYDKIMFTTINARTSNKLLEYLFLHIDDVSFINIERLLGSRGHCAALMINKFISAGMNIEKIYCKYVENGCVYSNIYHMFKYIKFEYISLIKQLTISKSYYVKLIMKIDPEKIDELLSSGCNIDFIEDDCNQNYHYGFSSDLLEKYGGKDSLFDKQTSMFDKHNIDPLFILKYMN